MTPPDASTSLARQAAELLDRLAVEEVTSSPSESSPIVQAAAMSLREAFLLYTAQAIEQPVPTASQPRAPAALQRVALNLGDIAPDFVAESTEGRISFHSWLGDSWGLLFSHPRDFTPVATTEVGYMAAAKHEFDRRGVKIIGLSNDPIDAHERWAHDIEETQGTALNYPIVADSTFEVSKLYGMRPAGTPSDDQAVRNVFVIGPDKKIKLLLVYPMSTGRNFDEVLRVIDSLQLTAKHRVATPVNWKAGEDVIIAGSVSNEEAKETYPDGWKEPRPYIRIVPEPK